MTTSAPEDRVRAVLDTERGRVAREAAEWLVKQSESPDDEPLNARIESWCAESALNREAWERTRRIYGQLGEAPAAHRSYWQDLAARRKAAARTVSAGASASRAGRRRAARTGRRFMGAAALALAACLALVAGPSIVLSLRSDYVTATAEVRTVVLEDGTQVRLGPRSALQVMYSPSSRHTRLLGGEAFFEVPRNEDRPFSVAAGGVVTTVLGTAFDVRLDSDGTAVAVQQGRVRVSAQGLPVPVREQLEAGESLKVESDGRIARATLAPEDVGGWQAGLLVARGRPIGEIVEALRRYHDGFIVIQDSAFAARRISGAYDLKTPAETLRGLASAHDAVVRQVTPWLLIVTAR